MKTREIAILSGAILVLFVLALGFFRYCDSRAIPMFLDVATYSSVDAIRDEFGPPLETVTLRTEDLTSFETLVQYGDFASAGAKVSSTTVQIAIWENQCPVQDPVQLLVLFEPSTGRVLDLITSVR